MKSVLEFLQMDHKHMQHELCHPRRQATFDNDAIEKKIKEIRNKKQQLKVQAQKKRQQLRAKQQRFENFPLQEILEQTIQPLDQSVTLIVKQKMKFIEDKVYIGTKNNVNNEYISKVIDSNEAKPALKYQLNLFMQDLLSNLQTDIVSGQYQIFNKKDVIVSKQQQSGNIGLQPGAAKLIQIKKVQLSQKIQQLRDQLSKTQLEQEKLSPIALKKKSFSIRSASVNGSMMQNSLNLQDFSIKSQRTKQAEEFVKKLRKQQNQQRKQHKKKEEQMRIMQVKSQQQKQEFEQRLKKEKHQELKKKFENDRKQKMDEFQKSSKAKAQYEKFLEEYRKRVPLFKEKEKNFEEKNRKQQKQKVVSILSEIKEMKRSIDINELKQHEKKYQIIRDEFEKEKTANLKHRQKEIYLRHKQDRLYFRGRYHSMIKQQIQKEPEDPSVKRDELLKRKKQFAQKIKKQFVPSIDQVKQKQLEKLISEINRNKPNVQQKSYNQLGNKYLGELHKLIKKCKQQGRIKIQIPEQIKPRYKNYLKQIKRQRKYATISYEGKNIEFLQKEALRIQEKAKRTQKILQLTEQINIEKQMKKIDELDMELLKSAQIKAKLLNQYDPVQQNQSDRQ